MYSRMRVDDDNEEENDDDIHDDAGIPGKYVPSNSH